MFKKPRISLNELENTVVNPKNQLEYISLMKIYELSKWKWGGVDKPTKRYIWSQHKENTALTIKEEFGYGFLGHFKDYKIISLPEFYDLQNIDPSKIKKIEDYFSSKKLKNSFSLRRL